MKKFLLLLLGVFIVLPALARDFTYEYEGQTLTYTVVDEEAKTCMTKAGSSYSSGNNVSGVLIIPPTAKDGDTEYSVTSIGAGAFYGCTGLTSVTLSDSVTVIDTEAFRGCIGLRSVSIPNSVTTIGDYAFRDCIGLTSMTIPDSVTSIGTGIFYDCTGLASVILSDSVTSISDYAFSGCSGLTSVTIPTSVTSIGGYAFNGCSGLTSVTIPTSVTSIGGYAFNGCSGLTSVTIPNSVTSIASYTFSGCSGLTSVTIPDSVTSIGSGAFSGCSGLTSVTLPNFITTIWDYAFSGCGGLTSVTIPNSVTSIGGGAFYKCYSLTSVTIPNSVTSIGHEAFYNCYSLTSVTIPNSVISINSKTFAYCYGLTSVTIPNSVTTIGDRAFYDCSCLTSVIIPDSVTSISDYAFNGCSGLTSVIIPNSVTSIGAGAFGDCSGLRSVIISNSVTSIGRGAFYGCTGLKKSAYPSGLENPFSNGISIEYPREGSIIEDGIIYGFYKSIIYFASASLKGDYSIPNSVTSIGDYAFYCCDLLDSVIIPNSVTSIGDYAFYMSYSSLKLAYPSGLDELVNSYEASIEYPREDSIIEDGFIYSPDKSTIYFAPASLKGEYSIPNSVTSIGDKAFAYCDRLNSVIISNSVTSIGSEAFKACGRLEKSAYPSGLENPFSNGISIEYPREDSIIEDGFIYSPDKSTIYFAPVSLEGEYSIPNSVTSIGDYAFYYCDRLDSVIIPNSVTSIGDHAFSFCGLTSVIIPNSVTSIGYYAFSWLFSLVKLAYPSGLNVSLGYSYGAVGIEYPREDSIIEDGFIYSPDKSTIYFAPVSLEGEYSIPNSVTSIGDYAFYYCDRLDSVIIPNSVTSIGDHAFSSCGRLNSVIIPNSVTSINAKAFYKCTALTEVIMPPSVETIGASAFAQNEKLTTVIMGHKVKEIGDEAFDNCDLSSIYITAQAPPKIYVCTFAGNDGVDLYVQGRSTVDEYFNYENWNRDFFRNTYYMSEPTELKVEGDKTLNGKPGDTFQLSAKLYPEDVTLPYVFWRSTNPEIASVDNNGLVTIHADINDGDACKIIAESLYADGPVVEMTVGSGITGIENIVDNYGSSNDEIDYNAPVEIYNLQGVRVSDIIDNLSPGVYIVRQGKNMAKIAVR